VTAKPKVDPQNTDADQQESKSKKTKLEKYADDGEVATTSKSNFTFKLWNDDSESHYWKDYELLAEQQEIHTDTAKNIIKLFQEENTIPFMCRYRREMIDNMPPERMRDIKIAFNHICHLRQKSETILKNLDKEKLLTTEVKDDIMCAKTLDELEHLVCTMAN
jgi:ribosomal protein S25